MKTLAMMSGRSAAVCPDSNLKQLKQQKGALDLRPIGIAGDGYAHSWLAKRCNPSNGMLQLVAYVLVLGDSKSDNHCNLQLKIHVKAK